MVKSIILIFLYTNQNTYTNTDAVALYTAPVSGIGVYQEFAKYEGSEVVHILTPQPWLRYHSDLIHYEVGGMSYSTSKKLLFVQIIKYEYYTANIGKYRWTDAGMGDGSGSYFYDPYNTVPSQILMSANTDVYDDENQLLHTIPIFSVEVPYDERWYDLYEPNTPPPDDPSVWPDMVYSRRGARYGYLSEMDFAIGPYHKLLSNHMETRISIVEGTV